MIACRKMIARLISCGLAAATTVIVLAGCSSETTSKQAEDVSTSAAAWRQPLFEGLGGVNFAITTHSNEAQSYFNQGLALAFAFNHAAADFAFTEATVYDPDCAMCYWGSALVLGPNVNANMEPSNAPRAFVLATRAKNLSTGATAKEKMLIGAILQRYLPEEPTTPEGRTELDAAYATAMRNASEAYPQDANIAALTAEALMDLHPWDFWDANGNSRPWTTEITDKIEAALALNPQHVGAIHLYIHAVEQSNTPERAEPYADRLADLAPTAGHLVHMPAHIYMRVGRYHDATLNNMRATVADDEFIRACRSNSPIYLAGYIPHNWHFGWVTAAIEGWRSKAYELADGTADALTKDLLRAPGMAVAQHYLVQPLFAKVRFSDWRAILATPEPAADLLYARGIWHYARGQAYASTGELANAQVEQAQLNALRNDPGIAELKFFNREGAADLLDIADRVLSGELLAADGNINAAMAALAEAVQLEDALPYTEPPEWFFPARHTLGALQLTAGDAKAAEATYLDDLAIMPKNGWALRGLVNALNAQGKTAAAAAAQTRFETAWKHADVTISGSRI